MIESVAGGVVADGVSAVNDGLEELDALAVHAAHAGERDGEVEIAARENSGEMTVLVCRAMGLGPDDEVGLVRVLDQYGIESYSRVIVHGLDEAVRLGVACWLRTWNAVEARGFGADDVVGQHGQ